LETSLALIVVAARFPLPLAAFGLLENSRAAFRKRLSWQLNIQMV
jgi:hypothetical protein